MNWICRFPFLSSREISLSIEKTITQQHIDQPTAVSDHFTLPAHSMDNIELVPLELITSNRDAIRKAREAFLISKGKTLEPFGLNRRDEIPSIYFSPVSLSIGFIVRTACKIMKLCLAKSISVFLSEYYPSQNSSCHF